MKKRIIYNIFLVSFFSFILILPNNIPAEDNSKSALIIYSNPIENEVILEKLENKVPLLNIDSILFEDLGDKTLDNYDLLILASSNKFSIDENDEQKIINFIENPYNAILTVSPHVDEFEDDLETLLGIENIKDIVPDDSGDIKWNITINNKIGIYDNGETFEYTGQIGSIEVSNEIQILASVNSSNSTDSDITELDYPIPIMVNASTDKSIIITCTLSPVPYVEEDQGLVLNQLPTFFDVLLGELISLTWDSLSIQQLSDPSATISTDGNNGDKNNILQPRNLDFSNNFAQLLILFLFALIVIFSMKILNLIRWLFEKTLGIFLIVFGAFYNIQDRILDHNDVLLNQSRADIIDYLEYIGTYGAHLREIKSMLKMGTGSLLWHLQVLEDFGWIGKYRINNYTVFVAEDYIDKFDPDLKQIELKLHSKYSKDIIETILNYKTNGSIDISTIEDHSGINRKAIRRQIKKMYDYYLIDIINEKPLEIKILDESKLNKIYQSLWKRQEFNQKQSNIRIQTIG